MAVSLAVTAMGSNRWPFATYDMFAFRTADSAWVVGAEVHLSDGRTIAADVWEILPLEFFRATSLIQRVYVEPQPPSVRRRLAAIIVDRLNRGGWPAFDERYASVRPADGEAVVGFELFWQRHQMLRIDDRIQRRAQRGPSIYAYAGDR